MGLLTHYNLRSIFVRKGTAIMTALGIAMVVAVFVITLALAQGFRATLVASGLPDNAIVLRRGATAENSSFLAKPDLPLIANLPEVARDETGQPLASPELLVIISLPRLSDGQPANVPLRGVGPTAFAVRNNVRIVEGRSFRPGMPEVIAGRQAVGRFTGLTRDRTVRFGNNTWTIVGLFEAEDSSFESEVWGDVDLMLPAFQRNGYQSVTAKLTSSAAFDSFQAAITADQRLTLSAQRERDYYAAQSAALTTVIRVFGSFVTLILSIGAIFGATNTMYAAVAYRIREIGTMRALGFPGWRIMLAFLAESIALALIGGVIGCMIALPVHGLSTGTTNFTSFSEVAFRFRITPAILAGGLVFAAVMGAVGGLLPAIRAARLPITQALRDI